MTVEPGKSRAGDRVREGGQKGVYRSLFWHTRTPLSPARLKLRRRGEGWRRPRPRHWRLLQRGALQALKRQILRVSDHIISVWINLSAPPENVSSFKSPPAPAAPRPQCHSFGLDDRSWRRERSSEEREGGRDDGRDDKLPLIDFKDRNRVAFKRPPVAIGQFQSMRCT